MAEKEATRSLLMGKFSVKTIPNWAIIIDARQLQEKTGLSRRLLKELDKMKSTSLRKKPKRKKKGTASSQSRTTLLIISELRKRNDPLWIELAEKWIIKHEPKEQPNEDNAEVAVVNEDEVNEDVNTPDKHHRKRYLIQMYRLLACAYRVKQEEPEKQKELAIKILKNPNAKVNDLVFATKCCARNSDKDNHPLEYNLCIKIAEESYGKRVMRRVMHTYALGCMQAQNHKFAEVILKNIIETSNSRSAFWGRAVWALARMYEVQENWAKVAKTFSLFADNQHIDVRFRVQAIRRNLLALLKLAEENRDSVKPSKVSDAVLSNALIRIGMLLSDVDRRTKLETARQVQLAIYKLPKSAKSKKDWITFRKLLVSEVVESSLEEIKKEEIHPTEVMPIILPLFRKLFYDFGDYQRLISFWEAIPEELWSKVKAQRLGRPYWESSLLVAIAYIIKKQAKKGVKLCKEVVASYPDQPLCTAMVELIYGWMRKDDKLALEHYIKATELAPTDRFIAVAWHSRMSDALERKELEQARIYSQKLRQCFLGNVPAFADQRIIDCEAALVMANFPKSADSAPDPLKGMYTQNFIQQRIDFLYGFYDLD